MAGADNYREMLTHVESDISKIRSLVFFGGVDGSRYVDVEIELLACFGAAARMNQVWGFLGVLGVCFPVCMYGCGVFVAVGSWVVSSAGGLGVVARRSGAAYSATKTVMVCVMRNSCVLGAMADFRTIDRERNPDVCVLEVCCGLSDS